MRYIVKIQIILMFLVFFSSAFAELKFLPNFPFKIGEKMTLMIHVLGVYIGDQQITLDDVTTYQGKRVLVGSGFLSTTPFISSMYKVEDWEKSWFQPENFTPLYYERWINEGEWHDNIRFRFSPDKQKVIYEQKVNGYDPKTISYKGTLRNYFTLIACMRSVDYDYHVANKLNVEIDYLFGTSIKTAKFKPSFKKIDYRGKRIDTIFLEEIGGIGMNFYIQNDGNRTPVRLIIPAFEVIGFKTINVDVELKEYTQGSMEIAPDVPIVIPTGVASSAPSLVKQIEGIEIPKGAMSNVKSNIKMKKK